MARINIEDSIYRDQRFFDLAIQVGSRELAIGCLVFAWDLAQRFVTSPSGLIPHSEWSKIKQSEAIASVGLARVEEAGVYVCGTRDHHAWLKERHEAARKGGLKSQENRRKQNQANESKLNTSSSPSSSPSEEFTHTHTNAHALDGQPSQAEELMPVSPKVKAPDPVRREDINKGIDAWLDTLRHFGMGRTNVLANEDAQIGRAMIRYGVKPVILALIGARFQPKDKRFDPGKFVSLTHYLDDKNFMRLMNLGVANATEAAS